MKRWRLLVGPAGLFALWSLVTWAGLVRPLFLPTPWKVLSALWFLLAEGPLWSDMAATLYRTITAFTLAAILGLLIGIPLGVSRQFYESSEIVLDFFRSLPSPALIPLAMLLLGLGDLSRISVAAFTCTLINAIQAAYALGDVPEQRLIAAKLAGARGTFLVRHVLVPSVVPRIVAGWRVTLSLSLIIIVVTEMFIGTQRGLGMRIYDSHLMFRSADMYAAILVVGVMGYLLNKGIEVLDQRLVHWRGK